jgi:hypothetical protein
LAKPTGTIGSFHVRVDAVGAVSGEFARMPFYRYWLARARFGFAAIFSFAPAPGFDGFPQWLYPVPSDMIQSFDPEEYCNNITHKLDPRKFEVSIREP